MPKSKIPLSFLESISNQKEGYRFGEPQRIDEKSLCVVLPIIRQTSLKRQYINLPECDKIDIIDTGSINKMRATNLSTENVFIRSGTIFKGSTQERTSTRSTVLFPGKTVDIDVRCVHASRGISPNSKVTYGGISPLSVENNVYTAGFTASDQHNYWKNVRETTNHLNQTLSSRGRLTRNERRAPTAGAAVRAVRQGMASGQRQPIQVNKLFDDDSNITGSLEFGSGVLYTNAAAPPGMDQADVVADSAFQTNDDLFSNLNSFSQTFDDLLSKLKSVEDQAGMALINEKGCQTIETFDHTQSWASLHKDAVKRVGSHVVNLDDTSVFAYKPENAVKAVQAVLSEDYDMNLIFDHKPANGEPLVTINGLTSKNYVGEVVELDNRVVHLLLLKRN